MTIRDEVAGILADRAVTGEAQSIRTMSPLARANRFLGQEIQMAQRARQRLADLVEPVPVRVHEQHAVSQPGRKCLAYDWMGPGAVVIEQVPAGRLL